MDDSFSRNIFSKYLIMTASRCQKKKKLAISDHCLEDDDYSVAINLSSACATVDSVFRALIGSSKLVIYSAIYLLAKFLL